jgi:predicted ATP-dependent protease
MEGYLRGRYASDRPLTLAASLVFEQSYGQVDGDSASAAELFALLSSISGVGLKQSLAVTGAISQQGEIQPIGGVKEKIEGFFEICQAKGLTGEHGVIIPAANVPDLMLKGQVIDAVKEGLFKVYAVRHADEALEILTGLEAGKRQEDGHFPKNTFNRAVEDKLTDLAEKAKMLLGNDSEKKGPIEAGPPNNCDSCGK